MTQLPASKNKVFLAVAGAGKTTKIVEDVLSKTIVKRIGIITYTNKAVASIVEKVQERNCGIIPSNVDIYTWYNFLYNQCVLPYQRVLFTSAKIKGIHFENFYGSPSFIAKTNYRRYVSEDGRLAAKYASDFAIECAKKSENLINRLSQIYEEIIIDEIQDMASEDLDLIEMLMDSPIRITLVGDSRQATFVTHHSPRNKKYKGMNIIKYFQSLEQTEKLDIEQWTACYRSNREICAFADRLFPQLAKAESKMTLRTQHDGVFLILEADLANYISYLNSEALKYEFLKFDKKTKASYPTHNFGECKGLTFDRTIIFANKPLEKFVTNFECTSPAKYYVGLTRARFSVAIVVRSFSKITTEYRDATLTYNDKTISLKEFIV